MPSRKPCLPNRGACRGPVFICCGHYWSCSEQLLLRPRAGLQPSTHCAPGRNVYIWSVCWDACPVRMCGKIRFLALKLPVLIGPSEIAAAQVIPAAVGICPELNLQLCPPQSSHGAAIPLWGMPDVLLLRYRMRRPAERLLPIMPRFKRLAGACLLAVSGVGYRPALASSPMGGFPIRLSHPIRLSSYSLTGDTDPV